MMNGVLYNPPAKQPRSQPTGVVGPTASHNERIENG